MYANATVFSLDHEMPDWGEMLRKRIGNKTTTPFIAEKWCDEVDDAYAHPIEWQGDLINTLKQ